MGQDGQGDLAGGAPIEQDSQLRLGFGLPVASNTLARLALRLIRPFVRRRARASPPGRCDQAVLLRDAGAGGKIVLLCLWGITVGRRKDRELAQWLHTCYTLSMVKQNASLDASFWINAYDANLVEFLPEYFVLFVCGMVAQEIRYPLDVLGVEGAAGPSLFVEWCESGVITLQDPREPVDWFEKGENAAIALAMERGYWLLMDDANPYHYAKSKNLKVVGTAELTVFLYDQGRLSYGEATATVKKLRSSKKQKRDAMIALEILARERGDRNGAG